MQTPWTDLCDLADLEPERGVAALVDGVQMAVIRLDDGEVVAVQQQDPVCGAYVMSRGIVGSRAGVPTISSPVYKQVYDLHTGHCLDGLGENPQPLHRFAVRVLDGRVQVGGRLVTHADDAEVSELEQPPARPGRPATVAP
ncbi:MAG: nitrite reductase small subunit NirD [Actinomycetales bacterium]